MIADCEVCDSEIDRSELVIDYAAGLDNQGASFHRECYLSATNNLDSRIPLSKIVTKERAII